MDLFVDASLVMMVIALAKWLRSDYFWVIG